MGQCLSLNLAGGASRSRAYVFSGKRSRSSRTLSPLNAEMLEHVPAKRERARDVTKISAIICS